MSDLNRIKPAFRTTGNVTGNFGKPKSKAGSPLNDINGDADPGSMPTKREFFYTLLQAYPSVPSRNKPGILSQLKALAATLNTQEELNYVIN